MIAVEPFVCNAFAQNTYIVYDEDRKEAFAVDAGMCEEAERLAFDRFLKQRQLTLKFLINTHLHLDHIFGNRFIADRYGVPLYYAKEDEFLLNDFASQAAAFGLQVGAEHLPPVSENSFSDGFSVAFADSEIKTISTPGHSPGSVLVYLPSESLLFSGDTLFRGGVGRTDLPGGNTVQLKESLKMTAAAFDESVKILPGHGLPTTLAFEKKYNPFLI